MPFCPSCGANVQGSFCQQCGANVGAGTPSAVPPPSGASSPQAAGLAQNAAAALCYLIGFITGIIFLVLEPYNRDPVVKFHAWQSILFNIAWVVFWIGFSIISGILSSISSALSLILFPISLLISLGGFILWLLLMWKAYNGQLFMLPIVGPLAKKQAGIQ